MNRIKDIREDKDLDQKTVADILGISQQYYSRYELGQVDLPIRHYIKLARFYNVSIDYLAGLSDIPTPADASLLSDFSLTKKQYRLLEAYSKNTDMQTAVDRLLNID